jgi:hypothetical protein
VSRDPFSKKTKSVSRKSDATLSATLSNDQSAILARSAQRQEINFSTVPLEVRNQTRTKTFETSFSSLVGTHSHHEFLTKQLLHGAQLDIGDRIVSFQTHQECYYGIEEFITFLNSADQPNHKQIACVADIDFQTTRNFSAYFLQTYPGRSVNRKRYGRCKAAISVLKRKLGENASVGKTIEWAQSPSSNDTPTESYSDEVFNQLIEASLTDIKFVMKMMTEYPEKLTAAKRTIKELAIRVNPHGLIAGVTPEESNLLCSALTSNAYPDWPLFMPFADAGHLLSVEWRRSQNGKTSVIDERYVFRTVTRMRLMHSVRYHHTGETQLFALEVGKLAYFAQFFFTVQTLFPFILYVQLNTGWNLESVLSLTDDLDSHLGEDLVDPDQYVLIYGTKWRTESVVHCRSNKHHPYSVFNVLRFIQQKILKFKASEHYRSGRLWQGILSINLWNRVKKIVTAIDSSAFSCESRNFLERHGISISANAERPAIESRRLRTTWETKRREQGLPLETITEMMGHSDVDITSIHYDRDAGSASLYNKKLRRLQNGWDDDFRNYGVRLSVSTTLEELRGAIGTACQESTVGKAAREIGVDGERAVVHLLSPEGQTYITACLDSKSPTWPDAERFVSPGGKCSYFNRCCMCSQAVIFKESLPYIVRRISDLTGLKTKINSVEWSGNYGEETSAWEQILNRWTPNSDVDEAKICAVSPKYVLPLTMRGAQ